MTEFTENIVKAIQAIPYGRVATYGQIAGMAGNPQGARQVSWTLRTQTKKYDLPWHRVIGSQGKISIKGEGGLLQEDLLRKEGIEVAMGGKIDLSLYQWK